MSEPGGIDSKPGSTDSSVDTRIPKPGKMVGQIKRENGGGYVEAILQTPVRQRSVSRQIVIASMNGTTDEAEGSAQVPSVHDHASPTHHAKLEERSLIHAKSREPMASTDVQSARRKAGSGSRDGPSNSVGGRAYESPIRSATPKQVDSPIHPRNHGNLSRNPAHDIGEQKKLLNQRKDYERCGLRIPNYEKDPIQIPAEEYLQGDAYYKQTSNPEDALRRGADAVSQKKADPLETYKYLSEVALERANRLASDIIPSVASIDETVEGIHKAIADLNSLKEHLLPRIPPLPMRNGVEKAMDGILKHLQAMGDLNDTARSEITAALGLTIRLEREDTEYRRRIDPEPQPCRFPMHPSQIRLLHVMDENHAQRLVIPFTKYHDDRKVKLAQKLGVQNASRSHPSSTDPSKAGPSKAGPSNPSALLPQSRSANKRPADDSVLLPAKRQVIDPNTGVFLKRMPPTVIPRSNNSVSYPTSSHIANPATMQGSNHSQTRTPTFNPPGVSYAANPQVLNPATIQGSNQRQIHPPTFDPSNGRVPYNGMQGNQNGEPSRSMGEPMMGSSPYHQSFGYGNPYEQHNG